MQTKRTIATARFVKKKGFVHRIVPAEQFTLLQGADVLTTYTFNTGIASILSAASVESAFCPSHPHSIDVNIAV